MDLSKQLKSNEMISLAQTFTQQPRNSVRHVFQACGKRCALKLTLLVRFVNCQPNSLSVPYCQQKPRNAELNGLFQCQFQSVDTKKFADGSTVGAAGTIPLGQNGPLNPPGSCPANPSGPIPDGQQLVDIVQSPGVPGGSAAGNGNTQNSSSAPSSASASATQSTPSSAASAASAANTSPSPTPSAVAGSSAPGFKAQNGKDAQALNQKFQSLTPNSPCTGKL